MNWEAFADGVIALLVCAIVILSYVLILITPPSAITVRRRIKHFTPAPVLRVVRSEKEWLLVSGARCVIDWIDVDGCPTYQGAIALFTKRGLLPALTKGTP